MKIIKRLGCYWPLMPFLIIVGIYEVAPLYSFCFADSMPRERRCFP